ncbi:hypothetical protein EG68_10648, partial [Paragonimus skrjabini miyazakii]
MAMHGEYKQESITSLRTLQLQFHNKFNLRVLSTVQLWEIKAHVSTFMTSISNIFHHQFSEITECNFSL